MTLLSAIRCYVSFQNSPLYFNKNCNILKLNSLSKIVELNHYKSILNNITNTDDHSVVFGTISKELGWLLSRDIPRLDNIQSPKLYFYSPDIMYSEFEN